jgi:hypothetical protein
MTHKNIDIANKYAGEACQVYTLDGIKEGIVSGRLHEFATIRALDGSINMQVNWPTVERKMTQDKLFYAC